MYFAAYEGQLGIDSAELCLSNINSRLKVALSDRQSVSAFRVSEVYLASPTQLCTVVVVTGAGPNFPRASGTCSPVPAPGYYKEA